MKERRKIGHFLQVRETTAVHHRHADVVDPLLLDQFLRVPDRIEDLAGRDGGRRMLTDHSEAFLQLCRHRVFHPEEMIWLELLTQPCRLNRSKPVMTVVQKVDIVTEMLSHPFE